MSLRRSCIVLIILLAFQSSSIYAVNYEKDSYSEDTIGIDGKLVKIRIDADTEAVTWYWDDKANAWAAASASPVDLDKIYKEKMEFTQMQQELNALKDETWDDRYRE